MEEIEDRIVAFAKTFPTLTNAPLEPWDPVALDTWAAGPAGTSGSRHAVACVLAVWQCPSNPVAAVRADLCAELRRVLEGCEQRVYAREETAPPLIGRRLANASGRARAAWRAYQVGELPEAREAADRAAELADEYAPLGRWLAVDRELREADILRELAAAETWRCGTFNAAAALASWDEGHRAAFLAWAKAPWFC